MRYKLPARLLLISLVLAAIAVMLIPGSSYSAQDRESPLAGSSVQHPAGTDALGRDRMVRVSAALLLSLAGALAASALTTAAAAAIGTLAAFSPPYLGGFILLVCDVFLALPWLFLLMMVRSALPLNASPAHSMALTFLVLAALGWPACARAVYRGASSFRSADWMLQARAEGLRPSQVVRYVVPNLLPLLVPQFIICIPAFIIAEANLGALGLGIGEPLPSWGGMLLELDNSAMLIRTSWVYLPIALLVLVLLLLEAVAVEDCPVRFSLRHLICAYAIAAATLSQSCAGQAAPRLPGELAWTIGYDPKTFDPAKVDDQESETVRYLTAGVLLRFNRFTQKVEARLAETWNLSEDGKTLTLKLHPGLKFSDGSSLTAKDAAWSVRRVLLPATGAPVAQEFLSPDGVTVETPDDRTLIVHLPKQVIGIEKVFDEIAIEPANRPSEGRVTAGPFVVADYHRSQYVRLRRNPYFPGRDSAGTALPYATGVRLDVLDNPEQEIRLFQRGEYDQISGLRPDYFGMLKQKTPASVRDLGPSLNTEQLWFNQAPQAPLPGWEKSWFQARAFRVAVSQGINRADLARIAYEGHATPAYSFISPANAAWYNKDIKSPHTDVSAARSALAAAGFRRDGSGLGVRFSGTAQATP